MLPGLIFVALLLSTGRLAGATEAIPVATRGELLYSTHCIACHNREVHWRDRRLVTDGKSLRSEVRRWQQMANLGWSEDEIEDVARYLRGAEYRQVVWE
ncbi:MAG: cytochrome c [Candidatus Accumulibacter sp.]|jgi:mono/diheme cytochrome c family protein|uniref:c-type cytochrome n=1 Tax=Accumulibacter sp. TaxID=2053492 RepID=UPI001A40B83A|nr:cytochrome c [Accumulibacter sp.]MBL8394238.1 cytochrome c [Accumulibacter sp.]